MANLFRVLKYVPPVPPFSPTDISGLLVWFDAQVGVNVDGSNLLTVWEDQSGNDRDTFYGAVPVPPLYVSDGIGGKYSLRWDGTQRAGANFTFPSSNNLTWIIVANCTNKGSGSTRRGLMGFVQDDFSRGWFLGMGIGYYGIHFTAAGAGGDFQSVDLGDTYHINEGTPYTVTYTKSSVEWNLYANGSYIRTVADDKNIIENPTTWAIGNTDDYYYQTPFYGDISEIIMYNSVLSETDRGKVETYLKNKYGHY